MRAPRIDDVIVIAAHRANSELAVMRMDHVCKSSSHEHRELFCSESLIVTSVYSEQVGLSQLDIRP